MKFESYMRSGLRKIILAGIFKLLSGTFLARVQIDLRVQSVRGTKITRQRIVILTELKKGIFVSVST